MTRDNDAVMAAHACEQFVVATHNETRPDALRQYATEAKNALDTYLKKEGVCDAS